jgi:YYY domain-containing protein
MIHDIFISILWYLILTLFGVVVLPLSMKLFRKLPEQGILLSRPLGWLLITLFPWYLAYFWFPFANWLIWLGIILLLALSFYLFQRNPQWFRRRFRASWRTALNGEIITLLVFILFLLVRMSDPNIDSTEKPMDAMLLSSLIVGDEIPPEDVWYAGEPVNYHYGGYVLHSIPARLTGIPVEYAYNLSVAGIAALAASVAFALGRALFGRCRLASISVIATLLIGNLASFFITFTFLGEQINLWTLRNSFLWKTSRVIYDSSVGNTNNLETINEYPFFSIVWADLHPHYSNMPFVLLFMAFCYAIGRTFWNSSPWRVIGNVWGLLLVAAFSCAFLLPTNVFDFPIFSLFYGFIILAIIIHRYFNRRRNWKDLALLVVIGALPIAGYILASPFWLEFQSPLEENPIQMSPHTTDLIEMLMVFGLHLLSSLLILGFLLYQRIQNMSAEEKGFIAAALGILLVAFWSWTGNLAFPLVMLLMLAMWLLSGLYAANRKIACFGASVNFNLLFAMIACALAWSIIAGAEVIFIKDNYGSPRMNTLFKFHYPCWFLFGIGLPVFFHLILRQTGDRRIRIFSYSVVSVLFIMSLVGPVFTITTFLFPNEPDRQFTLNGLQFMKQGSPHLYEIVQWVRENTDEDARLLEIPGCGYRHENLVSAFTGRPAYVGWGNHEALWRRGFEGIFQGGHLVRSMETYTVLTSPNGEQVKQFLREKGIDYVVIDQPQCDSNLTRMPDIMKGAYRQHLEPIIQRKGMLWNQDAPFELYRVPETDAANGGES